MTFGSWLPETGLCRRAKPRRKASIQGTRGNHWKKSLFLSPGLWAMELPPLPARRRRPRPLRRAGLGNRRTTSSQVLLVGSSREGTTRESGLKLQQEMTTGNPRKRQIALLSLPHALSLAVCVYIFSYTCTHLAVVAFVFMFALLSVHV